MESPGLADVTFSNSRYTFDRAQLIEAYSDDEELSFEVWIGAALYDSIEELILEINTQIELTIVTDKIPKVAYKDGVVSLSKMGTSIA